MSETQTQLQAYWTHLDELFPEIELENTARAESRAPSPIDGPSWQGDAWWKRPLAAVAAAVILLVAIGGTAWLVRGDSAAPPATDPPATDPPAPTAPTTAPSTAAPSTTSQTSILPADSEISSGWIRVPHELDVFGEGGGGITAVTPGGPGLVAVGSVCSGIVNGSSVCAEGAWTSVDGLTWERAPGGDGLFGQASLMDAASRDEMVVAVGVTCDMEGTTPCDPGIWTSTDGVDWARADQAPGVFEGCATLAGEQPCQTHMSTVVAGGPGFIAAGVDTRGPGIWTSADGLTWERALLDPTGFPQGTDVRQLLVTEQRLVATGDIWVDIYEGDEWVDFRMDARVWTSLDGIEWTAVPDGERLFDSADISRAVVWEAGITAIGYDCENNYACTDIIWNSPDGVTWTRTPFISGLDVPAEPQRITSGSLGLIVIGESNDNPEDPESGSQTVHFWTSQDGVAWELHDADPDVFPSQGINEFVWHEGRLIAVGSSATDHAPAVYVWAP